MAPERATPGANDPVPSSLDAKVWEVHVARIDSICLDPLLLLCIAVCSHKQVDMPMCPCQQTGYSSVGRASECRVLQQIMWSPARFRVAGFWLHSMRLANRCAKACNYKFYSETDSDDSLSLLPRAVKRHTVLQSWRPLTSQMTLWPSG